MARQTCKAVDLLYKISSLTPTTDIRQSTFDSESSWVNCGFCNKKKGKQNEKMFLIDFSWNIYMEYNAKIILPAIPNTIVLLAERMHLYPALCLP